MTNFGQFVRAIEQRASAISGLRTSAHALFLVSCAALIASILIYAVPGLAIPIAGKAGLLVALLSVSALGYLVGRMVKQDPARLLLEVDLRLGLDERLSSLYELRLRASRSVFRKHLEASLTELPWDRRKGLPVPRLVRWTFGLSGVFAVAAALFLFLPPRTHTVIAATTALPESSRQSIDVIGDMPIGLSEPDVPLPESLESGESTAVVRESPTEQFRLEDVLSELRSAEGTSSSIVGDASPDELGHLIDEQRAMIEMIRDFIESILERIQQEGGGLTDDERDQIRQQAGDATDPQLAESLMDLLDESGSDPSGVEDMLESLLSTFDVESPGADAGESEGASQSIPLQQDDPNWTSDLPAGDGSRPDDTSFGSEDASTEPDEPDAAGDAFPQEANIPGHEENPQLEGGDDEQTAESLGSDNSQPGFTREEAPATIGASGEFSSFITEGVPVELPTLFDPDRDVLTVDFERIQSILHARGIQEDVIDTVRKYFQLITEGGS